jgi:hypothetical protein
MGATERRRVIEQLRKEVGQRADCKGKPPKPSADDLRVQEATRESFFWATKYTETYNEHWVEEGRPGPYEPFPKLPYVRSTFNLLDAERILWIEKSRDMMVSWICVAYFTLKAMTVPERGVLFQTQKEEKVKELLKYARTLYRRQPDWLKIAFPLERGGQSDTIMRFAHGSYIRGIPGGADQIRIYHPWGYLND